MLLSYLPEKQLRLGLNQIRHRTVSGIIRIRCPFTSQISGSPYQVFPSVVVELPGNLRSSESRLIELETSGAGLSDLF